VCFIFVLALNLAFSVLADSKDSNSSFSQESVNNLTPLGYSALGSNDYYFEFLNLPSSVCEDEVLDIKLKGMVPFKPSPSNLIDCGLFDWSYAHWKIDLMEADVWPNPDDLIYRKFGYNKAYACLYIMTLMNEAWILPNIKLSDYAGGTEGDNIEIYAKIYDDGDEDNGIVLPMETSVHNVYVYRHGECQCLSGACCDLSKRPYKFKSYGSQPTDKNDYYFCSGTNSATGTSYVKLKDYYCSGKSAGSTYKIVTADICGICEYCSSGYPRCKPYSSSTSCGTRDCDYLDTPCRDYHDVKNYCDGHGNCKQSSCTDYTNKPKGTPCGSNSECDGKGKCVYCSRHDHYGCYDNDVYWYDKCGNREEKKKECGEDYCLSWTYYCDGDKKMRKRTCYSKGCASGQCYSESYVETELVEICEHGCIDIGGWNAKCKEICYKDSDCGTETRSELRCGTDGNVWATYFVPHCAHPGKEDSYCYTTEEDRIVQHCNGGCKNGKCVVACYKDSDCGTNGFVDAPFCGTDDWPFYLNSLYRKYRNYRCVNAGTINARCEYEDSYLKIGFCGRPDCTDWRDDSCYNYCDSWQDVYCKGNELWHKRTCHHRGCASGSCFDNTYMEEEKIKTCEYLCKNNACVSLPEDKVIDLLELAPNAYWHNNAGPVTWGADSESGAARYANNVVLEDNKKYVHVLYTHPKWQNGGFMHGRYRVTIKNNSVFFAKVGFLEGARCSSGAWFSISYWNGTDFVYLASLHADHDGKLNILSADLSKLSGKTIELYLNVDAGKDSYCDWAVWAEAKIIDRELLPYVLGDDVDIIGLAPVAEWYSSAGKLDWLADSPGGAARYFSGVLENNKRYARALYTHPQWKNNGHTGGRFRLKIPENASFYAKVGFSKGARCTSGATFILFYEDEEGILSPLATTHASYDGRLNRMRADLSSLGSKIVYLHLYTETDGDSYCDWANWIDAWISSSPEEEIDLLELAPDAYWHNNDGALPWDSDTMEGAASYHFDARLEDGKTYDRVLYVHPKWIKYGFTHAKYHVKIPGNSVLKAKVGLSYGAHRSGGVTFSVSYWNGSRFVYLASINAEYDGKLDEFEIDLSKLAGKTVDLYLNVDAGESPDYDWANWVEAKIVKKV